MADVVIIVGTKSGNERLPAAVIKQMAGRAGRKHGGDECIAYVITDEDSTDVLARLEQDDGYKVESSFVDADKVAFHILPEICAGRIKSLADAEDWYSRSLAFTQGNLCKMEMVIRNLIESEAITDSFEPTFIGETSAELYFHPLDVKAWLCNFEELFGSGFENDDSAVSWALGNVPMSKVNGDFGKHREVFDLYKNSLPSVFIINPGCIIKMVLWWSSLGVIPAGSMKNQMLGLKSDIDRVCRVLLRIDREANWGKAAFFKELVWRVKRGIPQNLLELCRIEGVTKGMAQYLDSQGVHTLEELRSGINNLTDIGADEIHILKGVAHGISRASR